MKPLIRWFLGGIVNLYKKTQPPNKSSLSKFQTSEQQCYGKHKPKHEQKKTGI